MSDLYYGSAAEAGSDLGLPLLLVASPSAAVPRHGERLSDFAPEVFDGARLFHRLPITRDLPNPAVWITGPNGTTEYVVWAVGCAEHAARAGRTAYLIDLDPAHPLRSLAPGVGHPLPRSVVDRIRRLGAPDAAEWATDLQGVRLVLPALEGERGPAGPDPSRTILVFASALPDQGEGVVIPPGAIEGVCFAAAIRDHTREELRGSVAGLRRLGHQMLGFIAMGPTPVSRHSPLDRWERVAPTAEVPAGAGTAPPPLSSAAAPISGPRDGEGGSSSARASEERSSVPGQSRPDTAPAGSKTPVSTAPPDAIRQPRPPAAAPEPVWVPDDTPEQPEEPEVLTPVEPPVTLLADWHRENRGRPRTGFLVLLGIVIVIAAASFWLRSTGRTPSSILSSIRRSKGTGVESEIPPPQAAGRMRGESQGREWREGGSPADLPALGTAGIDSSAGASQESTATGDEGQNLLPGMEPAVIDSTHLARVPEIWEQLSPSPGFAGVDSGGARPGPAAGPHVGPEPTDVTGTGQGPRIPPGEGAPDGSTGAGPVTDILKASWPDTFVVHVSSFRRAQDAETEVARLLASGVPARSITVILPERGRWHRVIVGAYPDSASAQREAGVLRAGGLVSFTQTLGSGGRGIGRQPVPR